jgi:2-polyprenyl-3-methyl-5-hydroxy-6-metoxy-1,4-benzoquinol methylase
MKQQEQTNRYFSSAAAEWQRKSIDGAGAYNIVAGRNRAAMDVLARTQGAKGFLDVGCGTGQLVIEAARRGLKSDGNDFAPEMIVQCEANAKAAGVQARFFGGSFFDAPFEDQSYDVISAQGFIEYISPQETDEFFARCFRMLRPGGALAVGSRNRLFNIFSLNDFTRLEAEMGTLNTLIAEATALQQSSTQEAAFLALRRYERIDPQFDRHPITGIPVTTRYQFSPADLVYRLRRCGLTPRALYPVHYHGLPTAFMADHSQLHVEIASLMDEIGLRDQRLVPFSSSFVVEARR